MDTGLHWDSWFQGREFEPIVGRMLCPWARNFNLVLLTQVYKWVPAYTGTHDPKVVSLNPVVSSKSSQYKA